MQLVIAPLNSGCNSRLEWAAVRRHSVEFTRKYQFRSRNELHLYTAEAKRFPLMYCANVFAQQTNALVTMRRNAWGTLVGGTTPTKLSIPMGDLDPTWLLETSLLTTPNGIWIISAVFAGFTVVTNRPTSPRHST